MLAVYGTRHALVLDGFHTSTTTTDLERLFEDFRDRGFSIRWINDTLALVVFRTPSIGTFCLSRMILVIEILRAIVYRMANMLRCLMLKC